MGIGSGVSSKEASDSNKQIYSATPLCRLNSYQNSTKISWTCNRFYPSERNPEPQFSDSKRRIMASFRFLALPARIGISASARFWPFNFLPAIPENKWKQRKVRSCASKALSTPAKVGIPIQVTQSFWIVVPLAFVRTIEILYSDTPDYVAAVGHASGWKHKYFLHGSKLCWLCS